MGPYKCPDCGTWWSGLEHRCSKPYIKIPYTLGHCCTCIQLASCPEHGHQYHYCAYPQYCSKHAVNTWQWRTPTTITY